MNELRLCSQFLGIKIEQDEKLCTISPSQKVYIDKILAFVDIDNWKETMSLLMANSNLIKNTGADEDEQLIQPYQSYLGTKM